MLIRALKARRAFRRQLALQTPLIDGRETKTVAAAISYSIEKAHEIIEEKVVPFDPRPTFPERLLAALNT